MAVGRVFCWAELRVCEPCTFFSDSERQVIASVCLQFFFFFHVYFPLFFPLLILLYAESPPLLLVYVILVFQLFYGHWRSKHYNWWLQWIYFQDFVGKMSSDFLLWKIVRERREGFLGDDDFLFLDSGFGLMPAWYFHETFMWFGCEHKIAFGLVIFAGWGWIMGLVIFPGLGQFFQNDLLWIHRIILYMRL